MWIKNSRGEKEFTGGQEAFSKAENEALNCNQFKADVDEEQVADELISCYNCRYRRWTVTSFICCSDNKMQSND